MTKGRLLFFASLCFGLLIGWVMGSAFPIPLWAYSDCHRLGGFMYQYYDDGDKLGCLIQVPKP